MLVDTRVVDPIANARFTYDFAQDVVGLYIGIIIAGSGMLIAQHYSLDARREPTP